jgi:outer membrane protein OmpA-like peptidoglycan-associated protein
VGGRAEAPSRRLQEVQRQRQERRGGARSVIREPDRRLIVKDNNLASIRHNDNQRLARIARGTRSNRSGGADVLSFSAPNGSRVFSEVNAEGRAVRRYRRAPDGREVTLFDDRRFYGPGLVALSTPFIDLEPPVIEMPREQYDVDYGAASEEDVYQALIAPPVDPLERSYALEEVRQGYQLRARMRSVELFDINFEAGSWEIAPDQYPKLERLAHAINRILQDRPDEVFLIEGHADVLDSDIDNLTLSDRRAEAVAFILSQMYGVPAENLVSQGYGDRFLKVDGGKSNRRVTVRRITPLLRHEDGPVAFRQNPSGLPPSAAGSLQLSVDDRAFIAENIDTSAEPGLGIGGLSEGMRVPGGARLRSFPLLVRERIPVLETYRYFLTENQLAIVDPDSAQVVAVVETNR